MHPAWILPLRACLYYASRLANVVVLANFIGLQANILLVLFAV